MSELLTRLRELSGMATQGPWTQDHCDVKAIYRMHTHHMAYGSNQVHAELIVLMRNHIDKLLDVVECARKVALEADPMFKSTIALQDALDALERT